MSRKVETLPGSLIGFDRYDLVEILIHQLKLEEPLPLHPEESFAPFGEKEVELTVNERVRIVRSIGIDGIPGRLHFHLSDEPENEDYLREVSNAFSPFSPLPIADWNVALEYPIRLVITHEDCGGETPGIVGRFPSKAIYPSLNFSPYSWDTVGLQGALFGCDVPDVDSFDCVFLPRDVGIISSMLFELDLSKKFAPSPNDY